MRPPPPPAVLAFVLIACGVNPSAPQPEIARDPARDATSVEPPASPPPTPPVAPTASVASTDFSGPVDVTANEEGALLVWGRAAPEIGHSELVAVRLDAAGVAVDEPSLLRTTSGDVVDVSVHGRGEQVWVTWLARLASEPQPRAIVAAMRVAGDLSTVTAPVTVSQFTTPHLDDAATVAVLDRGGAGAVVAAPGERIECDDIVAGRPTKCPGFQLVEVRIDGTLGATLRFGADGGDAELGSLVDLGSNVLVDAWAWHGGPTFAHAFLHPPATPIPVIECRPSFVRGWTGSELVTLCEGDFRDEAEQCPIGDDGTCARVHAVRADGTPVTTHRDHGTPLLSQRRGCHDGHPVLELAWNGGSLRVDPTRSGASVDVGLGEWTGRHALVVGSTGAVERWSCTDAGELVHDDEPVPPPPYAHPTAALQRPRLEGR